MNGVEVGPRGPLTVASGTACLVLFAVWLFTTGTTQLVAGLLGALAGLVLVAVSVASAVAEHQPGVVLVSLAFLGVGAVLTAMVFGFAYLGESITYLRGDPVTATVTHCERDDGELDDCVARWEVDGREYTGEIELDFDERPGETVAVRAAGEEAVRAGGLSVLVVASSGVAVATPLVVLAGFAFLGRRRRA